MALKTIKARAARAAELLESLKRIARVRREACSSPVLVVYGQDEAASIYFEGERNAEERPKPVIGLAGTVLSRIFPRHFP